MISRGITRGSLRQVIGKTLNYGHLPDKQGDSREKDAFVLWETKEDAEAAKEVLFPVLQGLLSGIAKSPPTIKLFEVIEPKV